MFHRVIHLPGPSSLGAVVGSGPQGVLLHHPLGFKDGTPTGRCWYLFILMLFGIGLKPTTS